MAPYQPGDVIQRTWPLIATLPHTSKNIFSACYHCRAERFPRYVGSTTKAPARKNCAACHKVAYCSRECQKSDWLAHHRDECFYLKRTAKDADLAEQLNLDSFRSWIRLILLLARAEKKKKRLGGDNDKEVVAADKFFALDKPRDEHISAILSSTFAQKLAMLRRVLAGEEFCASKTDRQLAEIIVRFDNEYRKCGGNVKAVVMCLDMTGYQHSCDPSASIVSRDDGFVYLIANRVIERDEDIRIAYVSNLYPKNIRRHFLTLYFPYITCKCRLCGDDDDSTRDNLLRSIRCSTNLSGGQCDAPCPMTSKHRVAAVKCASGHRQQFDADALEMYRVAQTIFEMEFYAENQEKTCLSIAMVSEMSAHALSRGYSRQALWDLLVRFRHPHYNTHVWSHGEHAPVDQPARTYLTMARKTILSTTFAGMANVDIIDSMQLVPSIDRYRLLARIDHILSLYYLWGKEGLVHDITHRLLRQLVPLVAFYYGSEHPKTRAFQRCAEMNRQEFQREAMEWAGELLGSISERRLKLNALALS